ncbi:hypothetical protein R6Q57_018720 [Mikania cordata]
MKKAIELTENADTKGIQVQIAGHIDRKEIARVEWIGEGRVPLQTIRAKIDYCSYTIRTIYGVSSWTGGSGHHALLFGRNGDLFVRVISGDRALAI